MRTCRLVRSTCDVQTLAGSGFPRRRPSESLGPGRLFAAAGELPTDAGRLLTAAGEFITAGGEILAGAGELPAGAGKLLTGAGELFTAAGRDLTGAGKLPAAADRLLTAVGEHLAFLDGESGGRLRSPKHPQGGSESRRVLARLPPGQAIVNSRELLEASVLAVTRGGWR
jgi:hypothetical protein